MPSYVVINDETNRRAEVFDYGDRESAALKAFKLIPADQAKLFEAADLDALKGQLQDELPDGYEISYTPVAQRESRPRRSTVKPHDLAEASGPEAEACARCINNRGTERDHEGRLVCPRCAKEIKREQRYPKDHDRRGRRRGRR